MKVLQRNRMTGQTETIDVGPGTDATISIGSDSYGATVVRTTDKTIYVKYDHRNEELSFRLNRSGSWCAKKHYFLRLGVKENHMDPSF